MKKQGDISWSGRAKKLFSVENSDFVLEQILVILIYIEEFLIYLKMY